MIPHKELLTNLSKKTELTLYLCSMEESMLYTFHAGEIFNSEIPEWMINYVNDNTSFFPFSQNNQDYLYSKIILDLNNILVFIDDPSFLSHTKIIKGLTSFSTVSEKDLDLLKVQNAKLKQANDKYTELIETLQKQLDEITSNESEKSKEVDDFKIKLHKSKQSNEQYRMVIEDLKKEIESLREQNNDQAYRLKNLLTENLNLSKIQMQYEEITSEFKVQEQYQQDLSYVIKSLYAVSNSPDQSSVDLEKLSSIMPVTASDLENYEFMKTYIFKLITMDREGKLGFSQLKELVSAFK